MRASFLELYQRRPELRSSQRAIQRAFDALAFCFRQGRRVYLCGNGGSAADAEHWAGELLKGFYRRRRPKERLRGKLRSLQDGLPVIPLTGFSSLRTAVANDIAAELDYAQLVWALGRPGDILVAISTSGNALNVNWAAKAARRRGMRVIALTGADGGTLRASANICLRVPATRTHLVQELHLATYHALSLAVEEAFFGDQ
jgi:D-sedoheptulose 7-phosphate isomerase